MIDIEELIPFMRPGYVAMNRNGYYEIVYKRAWNGFKNETYTDKKYDFI